MLRLLQGIVAAWWQARWKKVPTSTYCRSYHSGHDDKTTFFSITVQLMPWKDLFTWANFSLTTSPTIGSWFSGQRWANSHFDISTDFLFEMCPIPGHPHPIEPKRLRISGKMTTFYMDMFFIELCIFSCRHAEIFNLRNVTWITMVLPSSFIRNKNKSLLKILINHNMYDSCSYILSHMRRIQVWNEDVCNSTYMSIS